MNITQLIKNNVVTFQSYRKGFMYYEIKFEGCTYQFPVPLDDIGDATLLSQDKAIIFMRYIRKAIANNELVKIS